METTLHKDSGGLGFSIAGGRGSLPYKGNDEVCIYTKYIRSMDKQNTTLIISPEKFLLVITDQQVNLMVSKYLGHMNPS